MGSAGSGGCFTSLTSAAFGVGERDFWQQNVTNAATGSQDGVIYIYTYVSGADWIYIRIWCGLDLALTRRLTSLTSAVVDSRRLAA